MAKAEKFAADKIAGHMPAIGSGGGPFGRVDSAEGDDIRLAKSDR